MSTISLTMRAMSFHESARRALEELRREAEKSDRMVQMMTQRAKIMVDAVDDFPATRSVIAAYVAENCKAIVQDEIRRREQHVAATRDALMSALEADRQQDQVRAVSAGEAP